MTNQTLYGWDLTKCHEEQRREWMKLTPNCGEFKDENGKIYFLLTFSEPYLFHSFLIEYYDEMVVLREITRPIQVFKGFEKI